MVVITAPLKNAALSQTSSVLVLTNKPDFVSPHDTKSATLSSSTSRGDGGSGRGGAVDDEAYGPGP